jgi:glutaredoxin
MGVLMKKLTVYSMKGCAQCSQAIALLEKKGVPYEVKKVDEDAFAFSYIQFLGLRSMPQIFLGDNLFVAGGYKGLTKLTDKDWEALK